MASGQIHFHLSPFAEGGFREAFEATVDADRGRFMGFKPGSELVLKAMKPALYNRGIRITQADIDMQDQAAKLADEFTREVKPTKNGESCNLYMRTAKLHSFSEDKTNSAGKKIFRKGEKTALEMKVNGEWEKFNSNSGWSSGSATLPDAFSHWTWAHSDGDLLVCDLQGHRGREGGPKYGDREQYYYLLTDPAVISRDQRFGITDLGRIGMSNWFGQHECNSLCRTLGLHNRRPADSRKRLTCKRGSMYSDEI